MWSKCPKSGNEHSGRYGEWEQRRRGRGGSHWEASMEHSHRRTPRQGNQVLRSHRTYLVWQWHESCPLGATVKLTCELTEITHRVAIVLWCIGAFSSSMWGNGKGGPLKVEGNPIYLSSRMKSSQACEASMMIPFHRHSHSRSGGTTLRR